SARLRLGTNATSHSCCYLAAISFAALFVLRRASNGLFASSCLLLYTCTADSVRLGGSWLTTEWQTERSHEVTENAATTTNESRPTCAKSWGEDRKGEFGKSQLKKTCLPACSSLSRRKNKQC